MGDASVRDRLHWANRRGGRCPSAEYVDHLPCDGELLVGGYHEDGDPGLFAADPPSGRAGSPIELRVDVDPERGEATEGVLAHAWDVLPDARGEDHGVGAAEQRQVGAD